MNEAMVKRAQTDIHPVEMLVWASTIDSRIQSESAAIAYLLLALHQMGLGAVWMTGLLSQCKGEIEKILGVPETMDIIVLIPVGYPAESPTRERKPISELYTIIT